MTEQLTLSNQRQINPSPHPDMAEAVAVSRFWRLVERVSSPSDCWPWKGDRDRHGYGVFFYHGRMRPAHELALSFTTGELRHPHFDTCHTCDNPACCNPAHLRFDTRQANVQDMLSRGRGPNTARLTEAEVIHIRERRARGARQRDLARDFNISEAYVSNIVNGRSRKDAGGPIQTERAYRRG